MTESKGITCKLRNGSEVLLSEGDRVLALRMVKDGMPITVDADYIIDEVLATLAEVQKKITTSPGNAELLRTAWTRPLDDDRVAVAAAYWLDCSPHERTEADGVILARYARKAMTELADAQKTITNLQAEVKETAEASWGVVKENARLRNALDKSHSHLTYGDVSEALECLSKALGEEVES